jgi:hypothetical protein
MRRLWQGEDVATVAHLLKLQQHRERRRDA